jgi:long-subunit fatty acid transport protein
MKRIFITISIALVSLAAFPQGEMDALRYSTNGLTGTARSVAMGGAFGALGGDISGVAINPAGIGVYKSSEVVATMNFRNNHIETALNDGAVDKGKFSFSFDNMAFVSILPTFDNNVPLINFGFSYNRLKTFDRNYSMKGKQQVHSLTEVMQNMANENSRYGFGNNNFDLPYELWLPVLGYNAYLINPDGSGNYTSIFTNGRLDNILNVKERGYINSYDFNAGTTISNILSLGVTLAVTDVNYRVYSFYDESFDATYGYSLYNNLRTEGSGLQLKAGFILKPVNELRLGISYHSPTWYQMTNFFSTAIDHNVTDFVPAPKQGTYSPAYIESDTYTRDFDFQTPGKWTFSIAGILAQKAILSLDYEITNYGRMSFSEPNTEYNIYDEDQNIYIREDFKNASSLRLGAEFRFTPQISARAGYAWMESPIKSVLRKGSSTGDHTAAVAGPLSHFSLPDDAHYITYGFGYKFSPQFYGDIAFVIKNRTSDLYAFGGADKATYKNNMYSGLLTFGYKF